MKRIAALALAAILLGTFLGCAKSPASQTAGGPAAGMNGSRPAGEDIEKLYRMLSEEGKYYDVYVEAMKIVELAPDSEEAYGLAISALLKISEAGYEKIDALLARASENLPDAGGLIADTMEKASQIAVSPPFVSDTPEGGAVNTSGNVCGNTFMGEWKGGLFATQGEWTYFGNNEDEDKLYKVRAVYPSDLQKVCDDRACFINVLGDTIYYCNMDENNDIYAIRTDGQNRKKLTDGFCEFLSAENGWLYFGTERGVERMRTDGSERTQLLSVHTKYPYASGDWLYYLEKTERGGLWRIPVSGGEPRLLAEVPIIFYVKSGDNIYCLIDAFEDGMKIHRLGLDGSDGALIYQAEGKIDIFNVYDDKMFVMDRPPDNSRQAIVVLDLKTGREANRIEGYGTDQLYCADQLLFFLDANDNNHMIRVDLGNGNITPLVEK